MLTETQLLQILQQLMNNIQLTIQNIKFDFKIPPNNNNNGGNSGNGNNNGGGNNNNGGGNNGGGQTVVIETQPKNVRPTERLYNV